MSEIYLFGDESGTMPVLKKDGPFVAAFISYTNKDLNTLEINFHHGELLNNLKNHRITPIVNFVYPDEEFEVKFKKRMEKFEIMARYSKLMTNNTHLLLNADGIPIRNYIWIQGMVMAIGQSLLKIISVEKVERINIFIDQKSMVNSTRLFFKNNIADIPNKIYGVLSRNLERYPNYVKTSLSNFKFSSNDISINWKDSGNEIEYKTGFLLSHHLATYSCIILKKYGIDRLSEIYTESGFSNSLHDFTSHLLASLPKDAIDKWKRSTGLPEPNL